MDNLYAPWRMELLEGEREPGCLFCRAGAGSDGADSLVVTVGRSSLVMLNRYPYNPGHLMVAPLRHTAELGELTEPETLELFGLVARCTGILRRLMAPDAFNVGLNLGQAAGAGIVDHLHVHVVPRWSGDTNFMPVLASTKVIPEHLASTREKLLAAFKAE
ncbi:MAG TPA: HIT domain-containing protein [Candidatus Nitrosotalea sp.]|nr:HIT domain-containing protein [Candidatus Nitrosotalea sp.]